MIGRRRIWPLMFAIIVTMLFSGCAHHKVSARQLVAEMGVHRSSKGAHINILWYKGSDAEFDYFGYVYAMTGSKNFKVPHGELVLTRFDLSDDETKWVLIREIDDAWFASRIVISEEGWVRLKEGIRIEFSDGAPSKRDTRGTLGSPIS